MKKAFSLIELLISLITISVILASLAPMVTHKLKHGGVSIGTKKLSMTCPNTVGSDCTLCLGNQCIACPISCGNEFKNSITCKCESCTQSNCVNCSSGASRCDKCSDGYGLQSNGTCSACNAPYISNGGNSACIKCDSGYKYQNENLKTQCKECDTANGYFPNSDRKGCTQKTCTVGYRREGNSCTPCAGNTYQSNNSYSGTTCSSCGVNEIAKADHSGCSSTCVNKSTCGAQEKYNGCKCEPCGAGTQPNADKTACDAIPTAPQEPTITTCESGKYLENGSCHDCPTGCKTCSSSTNCSECTNDEDYKLVGTTCKAYSRPKSQADCDAWTDSKSIYVPYYKEKKVGGDFVQLSYASTVPTLSHITGFATIAITFVEIDESLGGFCITKFNAGDANGPAIPSSTVETKRAGQSGQNCDASSKNCCWTGGNGLAGAVKTANTEENGCITDANATKMHHTTDTSAFNYGGCNRTVCNAPAAEEICKIYAPGKTSMGDWVLPGGSEVGAINLGMKASPTGKTDTEVTNRSRIGRFSGASGLQLCQHGTVSNTAGLPKCNDSSRCFGAYGNKCYPYAVWGSNDKDDINFVPGLDPGATTVKTYYSFDGGHTGNTFFIPKKDYAYSVRCVLTKTIIPD